MTICRYFFENMRDGFKADALVWQRHNNIINFKNCQTYSLKMASFSFKCKLINSINVKFSENNAMDASRLNLNLLKIDALVHSICRLTPAMWSQIKRIAIQACKKVFFYIKEFAYTSTSTFSFTIISDFLWSHLQCKIFPCLYMNLHG